MSRLIRNTVQRVPHRRMSFISADAGTMGTSVYHKVNMATMALFPIALIVSPSKMVFPVDLALGFVLPFHAHIGMNYVITDYVPKFLSKSALGPARMAMAGVTGITVLGLTKLNLKGPGITRTVKSMWYKK